MKFSIGRDLLRCCLALIIWGLILANPLFAQVQPEQERASDAILLQGFHWTSWERPWYRVLQEQRLEFQDLGITHIWLPPPSNSGAREGYLPRQLDNLNSVYGTEKELRDLIQSLQTIGIQAVADIVINHRVGTFQFGDFTQPQWGCESVAKGDEWGLACGNPDSGKDFAPARDIDHSQAFVQRDLSRWLKERLMGVGFRGWRLDYALGYAPQYARFYIEASQPEFCVAEVWPEFQLERVNEHRQAIVQYLDAVGGRCGAFDFTSKGLLNQVLRQHDFARLVDGQGRAAGGIGWWPQKMLTFVDNHDTGPSPICEQGQNLWPAPCDRVLLGYAYILSHPGIPSLYYPHVFDWKLKQELLAMIKARRLADIRSTASLRIARAENSLYAAFIEGEKGTLAMKIGDRAWDPGSGFVLQTSGPSYALWVRLKN